MHLCTQNLRVRLAPVRLPLQGNACSSSGGGAQCRCSSTASDTAAGNDQAGSSAFIVTSEPGLRRLAAALSRELQAGDVYLLFGDVGAGKSAFRCAMDGAMK
jgi:hypothetical protein